MADNVQFQSTELATAPKVTIVETVDQGGGIHRQVIKIGTPQVEKWVAGSGVGLTWTAAFTASTLDTIASGNAILSDLAIANGTPLDIFCDVSVTLASLISGAGVPYIGVYLYPLNSDGSTYGDGRFGSSAAGPPPSTYFVGAVPLVPSVTQVQEGTIRGILLPPGSFKFVAYNLAGATLAGSGGNTCKYRTYNRSLV